MRIALTGGRVFDATGSSARPATIRIDGSQIAAIDPPGVAPPEGYTTLDVSGRTILPGLIDMHVHIQLCGEDSLYAFLGAGVTSVRDLGGDPDVLLEMRDALATNARIGPRLFVYGPMIDGSPPVFGESATTSPLTCVCGTPLEAARAADALVARGCDGVKVYAGQRPDMVEALVRAVDGRVPVAAHLGRTWASEAIELGVDTLEHVHATLYQDVVLPADRHTRDGGNGANPRYYSWLSEGWSRADLDADHVKRLIDRLVARRVVLSPTTVLMTGGMATLEALDEPGQRYRPKTMQMRRRRRQGADPLSDAAAASGDGRKPRPPREPEDATRPAGRWPGGPDPEIGRRARANELELLRRLHAAGGIITPSTDVGAAPLQVPGFALLRELSLLIEAGIPSRDVLVAATRTAAETLRAQDRIGTLEPGKLADMIVVDGDPEQDIEALRRLQHVIKGGAVYDPAEVLAKIET